MIDLSGRVALITGSGTGIGRGIALRLAELGAHVVVNGRREEPCRQTADLIEAEGGACSVVPGDASDEADIQRIYRTILEEDGRIDILVNNAAVQRVGFFDALTEEDWDTVLDAGLKGPFLCTREFVRHMRPNGFGRVINIGSEGALVGVVGQTAYTAAKAGLIGLTLNCAQEMAIWARKDPGDYTCNLIYPGFNETEMSGRHDSEQLERTLKAVPMGRATDSRRDVGSAVAYLASESAGFVTGSKFSTGGGIFMNVAT